MHYVQLVDCMWTGSYSYWSPWGLDRWLFCAWMINLSIQWLTVVFVVDRCFIAHMHAWARSHFVSADELNCLRLPADLMHLFSRRLRATQSLRSIRLVVSQHDMCGLTGKRQLPAGGLRVVWRINQASWCEVIFDNEYFLTAWLFWMRGLGPNALTGQLVYL